jgi:hypothetical protein
MIIAGIFVYFLPSMIAYLRGQRSQGSIFLFTLLLGWTVIGWLLALVWSFSSKTKTEAAILKHFEMPPSRHEPKYKRQIFLNQAVTNAYYERQNIQP